MVRLLRLLACFCLLQALTAEEVRPDFTILIPMRDGTELPTDIYLPEGDPKNAPCILMRNPSGRRASPWMHYTSLSKGGYVVAIQDARNAIDRSGKTMPYISDGWGEQQDGYDTVEWLAKSPFTNGSIGTIGFSAPGITQLLMAPSAPPSLKCQYIGVAAANLYDQAVFNGGQVLKDQVEGWLKSHGNHDDVLAFVLDQPDYNEFWDQVNTVKVAHRVRVPAIHYGGWYDIFLQGTIDSFVSRQHSGGVGAKGRQKLVIGPWTHQWPASAKLGDFEVPEAGRKAPFDMSPTRWFDHHLKGIDTKAEEIAPVTYYVMGPFDGSPSKGNVWKSATSWPIPAKDKVLFLTAEGKLQDKVPSKKGVKGYVYDSDKPVPTIGGKNLFIESGPKDQRLIESRDDVLVFTSEPLSEDLEVTGRVAAYLFFGSDRSDTDIAIRLTDVYPDGRSILISDGIYRFISEKNVEFREVEVDLYATSMVFAKGHRIRLSVTSSNYPRYEKNLNINILDKEDQKPEIAHNQLYFGEKNPSRIVLPIPTK